MERGGGNTNKLRRDTHTASAHIEARLFWCFKGGFVFPSLPRSLLVSSPRYFFFPAQIKTEAVLRGPAGPPLRPRLYSVSCVNDCLSVLMLLLSWLCCSRLTRTVVFLWCAVLGGSDARGHGPEDGDLWPGKCKRSLGATEAGSDGASPTKFPVVVIVQLFFLNFYICIQSYIWKEKRKNTTVYASFVNMLCLRME